MDTDQISELPDLSDWRFVEVWTIEEAALLWAAIDPIEHENVRIKDLKGQVRFLQYKKAGTYQRAISEAVCGGTLPYVSAWELFEDYQNSWEKEISFPELPNSSRIIPHLTRVSQAAFMKWVGSKKIPSYRQYLQKQQAKQKSESVIVINEIIEEESEPDFIEALALPAPSYLDSSHPRFTTKLKAAILAWEAVQEAPPGRTAKQGLEEWLANNAVELGLVKQDGSLNMEAIKEIAKVANWQLKGGPPKTPG